VDVSVLAQAEAVDQPGDLRAAARALVADEHELRGTAEPERVPDSAAQESTRLLEARERALRARVRIERDEIYLRDAEIAAHLDVADGDVNETRILDLRAQQVVQQPLQLCSDAASSCLLRHLQRSCNLGALVALDLIADLHVIVVAHADTALGSGAHLGDVVLESAQR